MSGSDAAAVASKRPFGVKGVIDGYSGQVKPSLGVTMSTADAKKSGMNHSEKNGRRSGANSRPSAGRGKCARGDGRFIGWRSGAAGGGGGGTAWRGQVVDRTGVGEALHAARAGRGGRARDRCDRQTEAHHAGGGAAGLAVDDRRGQSVRLGGTGDRRALRAGDGDVRVSEHRGGAWHAAGDGRVDAPGQDTGREEDEQDEEGAQVALLD
eukprot:ctg_299.g163